MFESVGLTFGWSIWGAVLLLSLIPVVISGVCWWILGKNDYSMSGGVFGVISAFWLLGALGAGITWLVIPDANHYNYAVSGTITEVSNTLAGGSGTLTSGYAFHLDTVDGVLYSGDDRMIALQDKRVDLICTLEWVPNAGDYYNCRPARNLP